MTEKTKKTEEEWRKELAPEQYEVLREKGTEAPFTGKYWDTTQEGMYRCAACGQPLFRSETKYDAGCGWPSFAQPVAPGNVDTDIDRSHGMMRTEVLCSKCGGHLGHIFPDGPGPEGTRYCMNSVSLELVPDEEAEDEC